MKKKTKVVLAVVLTGLLALGILLSVHWYQNNVIGSVGNAIIAEIDRCEDARLECTIVLTDMTDFVWDTVIVVSPDFVCAGYSDEKIAELFGVAYEMPSGYHSRLIFLKDNKVVYEESYQAQIEHVTKCNLLVENPYYRILPAEEAVFSAGRSQYQSEYCYFLSIS